MKEVTHDNLIRFIGACIDENNIFLLREYCAKGSLEVNKPQIQLRVPRIKNRETSWYIHKRSLETLLLQNATDQLALCYTQVVRRKLSNFFRRNYIYLFILNCLNKLLYFSEKYWLFTNKKCCKIASYVLCNIHLWISYFIFSCFLGNCCQWLNQAWLDLQVFSHPGHC